MSRCGGWAATAGRPRGRDSGTKLQREVESRESRDGNGSSKNSVYGLYGPGRRRCQAQGEAMQIEGWSAWLRSRREPGGGGSAGEDEHKRIGEQDAASGRWIAGGRERGHCNARLALPKLQEAPSALTWPTVARGACDAPQCAFH